MSEENWPEHLNEDQLKDLEYLRASNEVYQFECTIVSDISIDISKYCILRRLVRVTAWTISFIEKIRKRNNLRNSLTAEKHKDAGKFWISRIRGVDYNSDISSLEREKYI